MLPKISNFKGSPDVYIQNPIVENGPYLAQHVTKIVGTAVHALAPKLQNTSLDFCQCDDADIQITVIAMHPFYNMKSFVPTPQGKQRNDVCVEHVHSIFAAKVRTKRSTLLEMRIPK